MTKQSIAARRTNYTCVESEMTSSQHMDALAFAADHMARRATVCQVVRYDRARLLLTADEMVSNVLAAAATLGPLTMPTALIVSADQLDHWQSYTAQMSARGILRGVFTGAGAEDRARAWAAEMAQVSESMRSAWQTPSRWCFAR